MEGKKPVQDQRTNLKPARPIRHFGNQPDCRGEHNEYIWPPCISLNGRKSHGRAKYNNYI